MAQLTNERKQKFGRPDFPDAAEEIVESFESGTILGASRTIRLISEVFRIQVREAEGKEGPELASEIQQTGRYFIKTRGSLSPAVGNAITWMLDGLPQGNKDVSVADVCAFIEKRTHQFDEKSMADVERIAEFGSNLLEDGQRVMAYDYSSTVNAVLRRAAENGKHLTVVIPESRSLDGGMPILEEVVVFGHDALFTHDVAMGHELRSCSAVFVGVESLSANGGFWTTVGTCSLAVLADYYSVPLFAPTELLKIDPNSYEGLRRTTDRVAIRNFDDREFPAGEGTIVLEIDDLEFTPRHLVSAYITEQGVLPPEAIWTVARKFYEGKQQIA